MTPSIVTGEEPVDYTALTKDKDIKNIQDTAKAEDLAEEIKAQRQGVKK